eukprot:tig00020825_g14297.t1
MGNNSSHTSGAPDHAQPFALEPVLQTVASAIEQLRAKASAGCTFENHHMRVVGRRVGAADEDRYHKAVAYTSDVVPAGAGSAGSAMRERIMYRVEFMDTSGAHCAAARASWRIDSLRWLRCGGHVVFMAASSANGSIHDQIAYAEQQSGMGGPHTWLCCAPPVSAAAAAAASAPLPAALARYSRLPSRLLLHRPACADKDPLKQQASTKIGPLDFLNAIRALLEDLIRKGNIPGGYSSKQFTHDLWVGKLHIPEARQMMDKVKWVKDWGDLTQQVAIDISLSSRHLDEKIGTASQQLRAPSPRPGAQISPRPGYFDRPNA